MHKPGATSVAIPLVLDVMERIVLAILFGFLLWTFFQDWYETGNISSLILIISEGSVFAFVLIRRFASEVSMRPADWLLAFLGSTAPLLVQPTGSEPLAPALLCVPLMLAGFAFQISAKFSLRRSFGAVAANRGVKSGGPYRLVRHPMYAGYLMTQIGFLLLNPSLWNMAVYAAGFACQIGRILAEERVLGHDPKYREFAAVVRYRLIPGVL